MAGRGRRLGGYGEKDGPLRRPGETAVSPTTTGNINITSLIGKINDLNIYNIDPILLHETEILFKQLSVTGDAVKDILMSLHGQALNNSDFSEKLVIALDQVSMFEVDNVRVRTEWLTYLQNDHQLIETISRSDSRKFANIVMLLGDVYNVFKVGGKPLAFLGGALLDYFDHILKTDEENLFQVLTIQVILNGDKIMEDYGGRFDLLKQELRKILITKNLSSKARCWILLVIDYIANNLKLVSGALRELYFENLGADYLNLEARSKGTTPVKGDKDVAKSQISPSSKSETKNIKSNKGQDIFEDIENLNISNPVLKGGSVTKSNKLDHGIFTPGSRRSDEAKLRQKKQGSEIKISTGRSKSPKSDDDFYGIQIEKDKAKGVHAVDAKK